LHRSNTAQSDLSLFSDRDIGKWKANPQQAQKRRELFFELVTYDSWQVSSFQTFLFLFHTLIFIFTELDIWSTAIFVNSTY